MCGHVQQCDDCVLPVTRIAVSAQITSLLHQKVILIAKVCQRETLRAAGAVWASY